MLPRHVADYRALVWALVLFPLIPALEFAAPRFLPWLLPLNFYLAYCAGALAHNHTHVPLFAARRANRLYAAWLSVFYGCPIFAWLPTHQANHHVHVDGPADVTSTARHSRKNTLFAALTYPFACSARQWPLIWRHVLRARKNRRYFGALLAECAALVGVHAAAFALAIELHGVRLGVLVYFAALGLPAAFAPWAMMFTNYLQHVDCEPGSEHDHSRNFVSPWLNWLVFENGFHSAHHERPNLHWSLLRARHRELASKIAPALNQSSIVSYCVNQYFARPSMRLLRATRTRYSRRLRAA